MKVSKTRNLRINMGNYEHVDLTASVELDVDPGEWKIGMLADTIDATLDGILQHDVQDAMDASGNEDSFIYTWTQNKGVQ